MFSQLLRLSRHSLIYGIGAGASSIVNFFLLPLYTRYLSPADYGVLEIFTSTLFVLNIFAYLGLGAALVRFYFDSKEDEKRKEIISTVLLFQTASSIILVLVLLAFQEQFSQLIFDTNIYSSFFLIIFISLFFDAGVHITLMLLRARQKSAHYMTAVMARFVISAGLKIYFLVVLDKGVLGILQADLIAIVIVYLVLVSNVARTISLRFSFSKFKKMLYFGLPLIPSSLAVWVLALSDRFFLQFLSTPEQLGLYSIGYKFGMILQTILVAPFAIAWVPFMLDVAKRDDAKRIFSSVLTYFALIGMFIVLGLSVLSEQAIAIMTTPAFHGSHTIIPLIAVSYLLFGFYIVIEGSAHLEKKTKYVPLIIGTGAVLNLALNYLLIPSYGMMGAAVATLISYSILPVGMFFVARRYYPVQYEFGRVAKIFLAAVLVYAGIYFIHNDSMLLEGILKAVSLLAFPGLLFVFKFFTPQELQKGRELLGATGIRIKGVWRRIF